MEPAYPKGEEVFDSFYDTEGNLRYLLTCRSNRNYYFLYENKGKKLKKIGSSSDPDELARKFHLYQTQ